MFSIIRICVSRVQLSLPPSLVASGAPVRGAPAQEQRRNGEPGQFDFYVLALSWSPSFCEAAANARRIAARRSSNAATGPIISSSMGCGRNMSAASRANCQVPAPRLNRNIVSSMLDLMPSPRLDLQ